MSEHSKNLLTNCLVCGSEMISSHLPCNCSICLECSFEWIKTQNIDTLYLDTFFFNCSNFECKRQIDFEWINNKWPIDLVNELNEILIQKYLNGCFIKKCPKAGCNYSGYVESKYKSGDCPYICEKCQTTWSDGNNSYLGKYCDSNENFICNCFGTIIGFWGIIKQSLIEEISEIRISILYKSCIHCHRVINKFVGCDHITCVCKREFCYNCSKDYTDHLNSATSCQSSKTLKGLLIILLILILIFKTIFSFNIFMTIIIYIIWILWIEIFGIGFLYLMGFIVIGWGRMIYKKK